MSRKWISPTPASTLSRQKATQEPQYIVKVCKCAPKKGNIHRILIQAGAELKHTDDKGNRDYTAHELDVAKVKKAIGKTCMQSVWIEYNV